jgi:hypothetical protein
MRIRRQLAVILAAACMFGIGAAGASSAATPASSPPLIPPDSLVALPSELAEMGFDADVVARQEEFVSSLTPSQRRQQTTLRAQQSRTVAPDRVIEAVDTTSAPGGDTVSPMIVGRDCGGGSGYYKVWYGYQAGVGYKAACYKDSGTTPMPSSALLPNTVKLQPGNYRGRVFYHLANNFYWSVWRGPSMTEYDFYDLNLYGQVDVWRIQIA